MMSSSLLSALPMETSAFVCSLMLVAQVIIIIYTSSVFLLLPLQPNQSAFGTLSGPNEKIAFYSERDGNQEIYTMNAADGSNLTRLTDSPADDSNPSWSPDGTQIAFNSNRDSTEQENFQNQEIYVMNAADGSNPIRLTNNPAWDSLARWSPDGTKLAFYSERDVRGDIYVMNAADGSNQTRLTYSSTWDSFPSWSLDGTKIAFDTNRDGNQEIYVMNAADGSNQTRFTYNDVQDTGSSWSPNGTKIAFASDKDGNPEIYLMNAADGSEQTRLTNNTAAEGEPDW
jgi:Tol biopolymer transport system component